MKRARSWPKKVQIFIQYVSLSISEPHTETSPQDIALMPQIEQGSVQLLDRMTWSVIDRCAIFFFAKIFQRLVLNKAYHIPIPPIQPRTGSRRSNNVHQNDEPRNLRTDTRTARPRRCRYSRNPQRRPPPNRARLHLRHHRRRS